MYLICSQQHIIHIGRNTTIESNQYGIPDDNFNQLWISVEPDLAHFFPDPTTL